MKFLGIIFLIISINPLYSMHAKKTPRKTPQHYKSDQEPILKEPEKTPKKIIKDYKSDPNKILKIFEGYPIQSIIDFRCGPNDNVIHYIVKILAQKKDSHTNFPQLIENYKPLLMWLTESGVNINHVNDNYDTPYEVLVKSNNNEKLNSLEDFFGDWLKVHSNYIPFEADLRLLRKYIIKTITCDWCKNKQS